MANLAFKADHNICACLDLSALTSEAYHDLICYLIHSRVYFSPTIAHVIYEEYIRQFRSTTEVAIVDGVTSITALDGKSKKFLAYLRFLQHILHQQISDLSELDATLDLVHLNPIVFVSMKKNHSRSTFSRTETPLFPEMLGLSDGESEVSSSSSSSCL
ncbi:hypothetical protein L1987_46122 [Smallanthus sonchifolius]|uniref:Uncharacterized protein n=1 Tax=Smallanthus sonchifolius TaxID=185202 RepID=A0ACB9FZV6_9ASTR|nr:hypothetical protein L1987_46122 [Smallanthus sonchifolius]